jgi:sugar lactone lactonase YvrE
VYRPDGKHLAVSTGNTIRIWEAATGKELSHSIGHQSSVTSVAISGDGQMLASASQDGTIRLWNTKTTKETRVLGDSSSKQAGGGLGQWLKKAVGAVMGAGASDEGFTSVLFSPDDKTLISVGNQGTVKLWDPGTGKELRRFGGDWNWTQSAALSPDGKILASAHQDQMIRLRDLATGKTLHQLRGHQAWLSCVAYSPDGKTVASADHMGFLRLWNPATGKEMRHMNAGQGGTQVIAFSPNSQFLASGGWDNQIHLWKVSSGREIRTFPAQDNSVNSLAFSGDGKSLASGSYQGPLQLWEVASGKLRQTFTGHEGMVSSMAFSADGMTLISGSLDTTILVWSLPSQSPNHAATLLASSDLRKLWAHLSEEDGPQAYQAVWNLTTSPRETVPFLEKVLLPVPAANSHRIDRLISQLDDQRFQVRQEAASELERLGELASPKLRQALEARSSPEVRRRAEVLLDLADAQALSPDGMRTLRAVEVLERIATREARAVLQTLGSGAAGATITQEAKAALKRLEKRAPGPAMPTTRLPVILPRGA